MDENKVLNVKCEADGCENEANEFRFTKVGRTFLLDLIEINGLHLHHFSFCKEHWKDILLEVALGINEGL